MSYTVGSDADGVPPGVEKPGEKLALGVAARLSRYLQVLIQARKMGKETISSQELADYTHVNSTQIRRDLSGFGKFGKRGVGYNVESLVNQIRKILHTSGQHNIALFGAGHLGTAIATSDIFADHGFRVVAVFDVDQGKVGERIGPLETPDREERVPHMQSCERRPPEQRGDTDRQCRLQRGAQAVAPRHPEKDERPEDVEVFLDGEGPGGAVATHEVAS